MTRYGGISHRRSKQLPLNQMSPGELQRAIRGCTIGAVLALREGADEDVAWMLDRIDTLAIELARRCPEKSQVVRRQKGNRT